MEYSYFEKLFSVSFPVKVGDDKLTSVAYHESGHVLINLVYGLPGTTTTIIPDSRNNSAGSNEWIHNATNDYDLSGYLDGIGVEWDDEKQIEYSVISLLAGIIGESFYTGSFNWQGAQSDLNRIIDIFISYGIFDIPDLQTYWDKTVDIVSRNLDILKVIAKNLIEHKTLHQEYFDDLYPLVNY